MADGDIKDLTRRTASDKILGVIKHLIFLKILKIRYQRGLATLIYIFFGKKSSGGSAMLANKSAAHIENISNKELAKEIHKPMIRKVKKRKVYSSFIRKIGVLILPTCS